MKRIALAAALLLAGCATDRPEPKVETQTVNVAVPVPCHVDTAKQRPDLMNLDQLRAALTAAPNVDTKAQIVMAQLLAHMGWVSVVEAALAGCDERAP